MQMPRKSENMKKRIINGIELLVQIITMYLFFNVIGITRKEVKYFSNY